jgi:hypothetical protein
MDQAAIFRYHEELDRHNTNVNLVFKIPGISNILFIHYNVWLQISVEFVPYYLRKITLISVRQ